MNKKIKTIRISDTTHARLNEAGKRNETFDDIIVRLLNSAAERGQIPKAKKGGEKE